MNVYIVIQLYNIEYYKEIIINVIQSIKRARASMTGLGIAPGFLPMALLVH